MRTAAQLETARTAPVVGPRDAALRSARTCYDHLAGRLGVALADALAGQGYMELTDDAGVLTDRGVSLLKRLGMDVPALLRASGARRRVLCRPCLDWSERRPHLAGSFGAALCAHSFEAGWIRRVQGTRAVAITPKGMRIYRDVIGASV
jgi:hypothetical protein